MTAMTPKIKKQKRTPIVSRRKQQLAHAKTIDLATLSPEDRKRIEKVLNRRDTIFSLRMREHDIETWRKAAAAKGEKITEWVERTLNKAAAKEG